MRHQFYWVLIIVLLLTACSSKEDDIRKATEQELKAANIALKNLGNALDGGTIRNAIQLKSYAEVLKKQKPDLTSLINEIAKDATKKGPLYNNLNTRYQQAKDKALFPTWQERLTEIQVIRQAASTTLFNDALSDSINVLADMSDGKLPRVKAMAKTAERKSNQAKDYGSGSQYIGNPNYGHWQSSSSGTSFWAWYGMYSMFSNLTRPTYYNDWSNHRGYSYYSDYGRSRYTSPKQRSNQNTVFEKTKKSFSSQGKRFNSPYSRKKIGSSSLSYASKTPSSSSRSFSKSRFANTSSYARSSYANKPRVSRSSYSSSRSGYSRTSRSYSGGK